MPMHDWSRVEPSINHHFHSRWIYAIADHLNSSVLPKSYYALAEQITRTMGPDVLTLERPANPPTTSTKLGGPVLELATSPPGSLFTTVAKSKPRSRRQRRLSIRHVRNHRMVAVLELVSPSNKSNRHNFSTFVNKAIAVLESQIHLLVIDPFRPGKRDPNGVHAAIWQEAVGQPFHLPLGKPLTIASYSSAAELRAFVDPVAIGETLPDVPLFLEPEAYVKVPLEATYQAAWEPFPEEWKVVFTAV